MPTLSNFPSFLAKGLKSCNSVINTKHIFLCRTCSTSKILLCCSLGYIVAWCCWQSEMDRARASQKNASSLPSLTGLSIPLWTV
jgi:hypothetical protein